MNTAYLALGSNEGDRKATLEKALEGVGESCGEIVFRSSVYETAAWGLEDQPDFLNMVVAISTALSAPGLFTAIRRIEKDLGRQRTTRWGQRTIDLDILFYNSDIINTPDLTIPHPRLQERRFVLVPLCEIAPGFRHPSLGKTMVELLAECPDKLEVRKVIE